MRNMRFNVSGKRPIVWAFYGMNMCYVMFGAAGTAPYLSVGLVLGACCSGVGCQYFISFNGIGLDIVLPPGVVASGLVLVAEHRSCCSMRLLHVSLLF